MPNLDVFFCHSFYDVVMTVNNPQKTFVSAQNFHKQGKLDDAFKLYKELHKLIPHEIIFINLLAQVSLEKNKHLDGIEWLKKSLNVNPNQFLVHLNLGTAYFELSQFEEALKHFEASIQIEPQYALAHYNKGQTEKNLARYQDALKSYNRAIQLNPQYAEAMNGIGRVYYALKLHDEELEAYQHALIANPRYVEACFNLGVTYAELKKWDEAIPYYEKAAHIHPNYEQAYNNLGVALEAMQRYDEAIVAYQKAISIKPKYPEAYNNMAVAYHNQYQYKKAEEAYQQAIKYKLDYSEAYCHLGNLYTDLKEWNKALDAYHQAIKINPGEPSAYKYMGISYLSSFQFKEGWEFYEKGLSENERIPLNLKGTPIQDLNLSTKHVLIIGEQGIGDEIIYGSFINEFKDMCLKLTVALDERLISLFSRFSPDIRFINKKETFEKVSYDHYVYVSNLSKFLRPDIESFKHVFKPYIKPDFERTNKIRSLIRTNERKIIGIAWKSQNEKIGHNKSVSLETLLPILKLPNVTFLDLQYGDTTKEKEDLFRKYGVKIFSYKEVDNFNDIDGLASLIEICDTVISISNATIHIAGALGKKAYLLLPSTRGKLYYWHHVDEHNRSMWYPSVEIRSQAITGEWGDTIQKLAHELNESFK